MNSADFEAKLDEALSRLAESDAPEQPAWDIPETEELVLVARRLQVLAPAPMPDLARGRKKVLAQAVQVVARPGSNHRRWPLQLTSHRLLAFAPGVAVVLVIGVIIALIASSVVAGIPGASGWWFSSTPTMRPTNTATPTQISLAPVDSSQIRSGWVSDIDLHLYLPAPNPAPLAETSRRTLK